MIKIYDVLNIKQRSSLHPEAVMNVAIGNIPASPNRNTPLFERFRRPVVFFEYEKTTPPTVKEKYFPKLEN